MRTVEKLAETRSKLAECHAKPAECVRQLLCLQQILSQ
jgi:hypothetical protein